MFNFFKTQLLCLCVYRDTGSGCRMYFLLLVMFKKASKHWFVHSTEYKDLYLYQQYFWHMLFVFCVLFFVFFFTNWALEHETLQMQI